MIDQLCLYKNMKRWLVTQGAIVLDLLLPVINDSSLDPKVRYNCINEELDKHFNIQSYYGIQVTRNLPLLLVSFTEIDYDDCYPEYLIIFDTYFSTVSPRDTCDSVFTLHNSPEALLEYQRRMNIALCTMLENMHKDLRHKMFSDGEWRYPINYDVARQTNGSLVGDVEHEIAHFETKFIISDNVSCC